MIFTVSVSHEGPLPGWSVLLCPITQATRHFNKQSLQFQSGLDQLDWAAIPAQSMGQEKQMALIE